MKILNTSTALLTFFLFFLMGGLELYSQSEYRSADEAAGIEVGAYVSDFIAIDQNGEAFSLKEALEASPVVLVFYRGHWCPLCNRHLSQLQDSLNLISNAGAQVVGISPEKPEFLVQTAEKTQADFRLLHDREYLISDLFDVTFRPSDREIKGLQTMLGADLKNAHSDQSERLPIPATFIVDQNGQVVWRHFDPDYRERSSVKDIMDNLPD